MDRPRVEAVFFDWYGTVADIGALVVGCEAAAPGQGQELAARWRARQLELTWLRTIMGSWADFEAVTADALTTALAELKIEVTDPARARLASCFVELPARPEAVAALADLRAAGLRLGVLSNASRGMLALGLDRTGLRSAFDDVLSVDAARRYKPDPAVYRLAVETVETNPDRIGFVTTNGWDAAGAGAFGLRVAWLPHGVDETLPLVGAPGPVVAGWRELVEIFRSI